jgi:hypothetical protein
MVHSIELVFDTETEDRIRCIWDELAAAGVPSQAPASRPHVTLTVAERIDSRVDALLAPVGDTLPFGCVLGAALLFGRSPVVLARLVVPTIELLTVHAEVHRLCAPHLWGGPKSQARPGQWTGHVTLARRVGPARLGRALRVAGRGDISGSLVGLRRWDGNNRTEYLIS